MSALADFRVLYVWGHRPGVAALIEAELDRMRALGVHVTSLEHRSLSGIPSVPDEATLLRWEDEGEPRLARFHDVLRKEAARHDVVVFNHEMLVTGRFLRSLEGPYRVLVSGDDPENSDRCSKPYCAAVDHAFSWGVEFDERSLIVDRFREWGAPRADIWPHGVRGDMYDPSLTAERILREDRDLDLVYIGSPENKAPRLRQVKMRIPRLKVFGRGWGWSGWIHGLGRVREVSQEELVGIYQRTRVGLNVHMSFGPSNVRTFQLPANGAAEVVDCPRGVARLYAPGEELLTFDDIPEACRQIRELLRDEPRRRRIAAAGWARTMRDYRHVVTFRDALVRMVEGMIEDGRGRTLAGRPLPEVAQALRALRP